jgi:predicted transporter
MIFPRATRLVAILSVVLAFGILVCGSPVLTEKRLASIAANQTYDILSKLQSDLNKQYSKISMLFVQYIVYNQLLI